MEGRKRKRKVGGGNRGITRARRTNGVKAILNLEKKILLGEKIPKSVFNWAIKLACIETR